jgi:hypothetical protein
LQGILLLDLLLGADLDCGSSADLALLSCKQQRFWRCASILSFLQWLHGSVAASSP